jgi:dissimilatory sulfite reductase (desulfoviridin) alpha/beta subunit
MANQTGNNISFQMRPIYIIADVKTENLQEVKERLKKKGYAVMNAEKGSSIRDITICEVVITLAGFENCKHARDLYQIALKSNKTFLSRFVVYESYSPLGARIRANKRAILRIRKDSAENTLTENC